MLLDSGNQIFKLELSRRRQDDPESDVPIAPEVGASTDRAAKVRVAYRPAGRPDTGRQKLVAERNAAVALTTLFIVGAGELHRA